MLYRVKGLRNEAIFGLVEVVIWPTVLLKTPMARKRSKIIRVTFLLKVIIQFRLFCDY